MISSSNSYSMDTELAEKNLDLMLKLIPDVNNFHLRSGNLHKLFSSIANQAVQNLFQCSEPIPRDFGPFGKLFMPYFEMGAVTSLNLFELDELIIFSFYWANRNRYRNALDIGANIGLHSIIMNRCGFKVVSYEPDPTHFTKLKQNLDLNKCDNVTPVNAAVSNVSGKMEFIRLLGNTTGSHLAGSKPNPYGSMEKFQVRVDQFNSLIRSVDLVKIDAEGHESTILLSTTKEDWSGTDAIVEVSGKTNAAIIFAHFKQIGVRLFSQKINWQRVTSSSDMPHSYRDGSLFITTKPHMNW